MQNTETDEHEVDAMKSENTRTSTSAWCRAGTSRLGAEADTELCSTLQLPPNGSGKPQYRTIAWGRVQNKCLPLRCARNCSYGHKHSTDCAPKSSQSILTSIFPKPNHPC